MPSGISVRSSSPSTGLSRRSTACSLLNYAKHPTEHFFEYLFVMAGGSIVILIVLEMFGIHVLV
jgi:hypothetical protein